MVGGSIVLGSIAITILPILIYDWLNEVENPSRLEDFYKFHKCFKLRLNHLINSSIAIYLMKMFWFLLYL